MELCVVSHVVSVILFRNAYLTRFLIYLIAGPSHLHLRSLSQVNRVYVGQRFRDTMAPLAARPDTLAKIVNYLVLTCRRCWPLQRSAWLWYRTYTLSYGRVPMCYHCGGRNWEGPAVRRPERGTAMYTPKKKTANGDLSIDTASEDNDNDFEADLMYVPPTYTSMVYLGYACAESLFTGLALLSKRKLSSWVDLANNALVWLGHHDLGELLLFWTMSVRPLHFAIVASIAQHYYPDGVQVQCLDSGTIFWYLPNGVVSILHVLLPMMPVFIIGESTGVYVYAFS